VITFINFRGVFCYKNHSQEANEREKHLSLVKIFLLKKIFKILVLSVLTLIILLVLFCGAFYFTYNEEVPSGKQGVAADKLAYKMLNALNYEAYKETNFLAWTFRGKHHYQWSKNQNRCSVQWDDFTVQLDLKNKHNSTVSVGGQPYSGKEKEQLISKALAYFNNDSFWLVAPYKVFDVGVERRLVKQKDGFDALLVTYTSGGTTPGDSYLWHLDEQGIPTSYQMWVQIIPFQGISASWEQWVTTESGTQLSRFHKLLFLDIIMSSIQATK